MIDARFAKVQTTEEGLSIMLKADIDQLPYTADLLKEKVKVVKEGFFSEDVRVKDGLNTAIAAILRARTNLEEAHKALDLATRAILGEGEGNEEQPGHVEEALFESTE